MNFFFIIKMSFSHVKKKIAIELKLHQENIFEFIELRK